jgi:hypothetical protein
VIYAPSGACPAELFVRRGSVSVQPQDGYQDRLVGKLSPSSRRIHIKFTAMTGQVRALQADVCVSCVYSM